MKIRIALFLVVPIISVNANAAPAQEFKKELPSVDTNVAKQLKGSATESAVDSWLNDWGISCTRDSAGTRTITDVRPGSLAERSALQSGDVIVKTESPQKSGLFVTIKREGRTYRAFLSDAKGLGTATHSNAPPVTSFNAPSAADVAAMDKEAEKHMQAALHTNNIFDRYYELWLSSFYNPRDSQMRELLLEAGRDLQRQVLLNGGKRYNTWVAFGGRSGDVRHLLNGGVRLFAIGDTEHAIALFKEVLKFDSRNTDAYFNLGAVAENQGRLDAALEYYKSAVQCDSTDTTLREAIARLGKDPVLFSGGLTADIKRHQAHSDIFADPLSYKLNAGLCGNCRILRGRIMAPD